MSPTEVTTGLQELHAQYIEKLNQVLDEGRADLAFELVNAYTDEALRLITSEELTESRLNQRRPPTS